MKNILKLENIDYFVKTDSEDLHVLKNINLEIKENEFITIMGPSGSGKSSLLYIIGLIAKASSGKIFFYDENILEYNFNKESIYKNENLGFIFQFHYLIDDFTVFDNILLPFYKKSRSFNIKKEKKKEIETLLSDFGILEKKDEYPKGLSGGEKQRVSLLRAIVNKPKLLLCDEPTGNLDSKLSIKTVNYLKKISKELGITILMVTHNEKFVDYSDRVIRLIDGKIA